MSTKLFFAFVWEESKIEKYYCKEGHNVLMVGSGGETLIDLMPFNMHIDVIDSNELQIALCVLKILILHAINNNVEFKDVTNCKISRNKLYMHLLTGQCSDYNKLLDLLKNTYNNLPYIKYLDVWRNHLELLNNGVLFQGELEKTFKDLVKSNMNFRNNFNNENLIDKFGSSAVNLSNDFAQRFYEIYATYRKSYTSDTDANRFYYRMMYGFDSVKIVDKMINDFKNVTMDMMSHVNFIHDDMQNYVKTCSKKYDLVQTSNITDWLNTKENVKAFIQNVDDICKFDGVTLWRSLNGDYDLFDMLSHHNDMIAPHTDSSWFYKSIYGVKKKLNFKKLLHDVSNTINMDNTKNHPYFSKLFCKTIDIQDFHKTQVPFYYAVQHWVVALQALSKKLMLANEEKMSCLLNENINDELGIETGITHVQTFHDFLNAMNSTTLCENECVDEFNNYLDNMIQNRSFTYVFAYLGAIEYQYIFVSTIIKDYVDFYNINQPHYTTHEIMDVKHSNDLFTMAIHFTKDNFDDLYNGINDGHTNFMKLYENLSKVSFNT